MIAPSIFMPHQMITVVLNELLLRWEMINLEKYLLIRSFRIKRQKSSNLGINEMIAQKGLKNLRKNKMTLSSSSISSSKIKS